MATQDQVFALLETMTERIAALEAQLQAANRPASREPKVALPDKFSGDPRRLREFLCTVRTIFMLQEAHYDTDIKKVGFLGTLFSGKALSWYRVLEERDDPVRNNYLQFIQLLKNVFGDPNTKRNAQRAIRALSQGSGSTLSYVTRFFELSLDAQFDAEAKFAYFYEGLASDVKDSLATVPFVPDDFDELTQLAIRIDPMYSA
eukprot:Platyproteum_vivax@DN10145_c0_g1_i1.p1